MIDVESFITVKGFKAKGKRLSTFQIDRIEELEPLRYPDAPADTEPVDAEQESDTENLDPDKDKSEQEVIDEITGQLNLFSKDDDKKEE